MTFSEHVFLYCERGTERCAAGRAHQRHQQCRVSACRPDRASAPALAPAARSGAPTSISWSLLVLCDRARQPRLPSVRDPGNRTARCRSDRRVHARLSRLRAESLPWRAGWLDGAAGDRLHRDHGDDHAGAMLGRGDRLPGPEIQGAKPCLNGSLFYLPALARADRRRPAGRGAASSRRRLICCGPRRSSPSPSRSGRSILRCATRS